MMVGFFAASKQTNSAHYTSDPHHGYGPLWMQKLLVILLCCYPFIGARFLPLGDSGRYLSVLIAPIGLFFLVCFVKKDALFFLRMGFQRLWIWLPFFLAFGLVYAIHPTDFKWPQLVQKFIFTLVLYACARALNIQQRQLIVAAAVGAFLYFFCSLWDAWTYYHPQAFQYHYPRHLTETGIYRVGGGGGNPIHFANAAMWLSGICALGFVYLQSSSSGVAEKTAVLLASLVAFLVCLLTHSRGALLALAPLFLLLILQVNTRYRRVVFLLLIITLMLGITLATQTVFFHRLKRLFFDLYYYLTEPQFIISSVSARLEMWHMTLQAWKHNIIFGTGVNSITELLQIYPSSQAVHPVILMQPHFHNDWIQSISIGGLILLLGLLSSYLLLIYRSRQQVIGLWMVLAALFFGLSDLIMFQNTMLTFFISAWALFSASYDQQKFESENTDCCRHPL